MRVAVCEMCGHLAKAEQHRQELAEFMLEMVGAAYAVHETCQNMGYDESVFLDVASRLGGSIENAKMAFSVASKIESGETLGKSVEYLSFSTMVRLERLKTKTLIWAVVNTAKGGWGEEFFGYDVCPQEVLEAVEYG